MIAPRTLVLLALSVALGSIALSSRASANVNLEWRGRVCQQTVESGETVEIGLYAVSDDDTDQPFLGIQAVFAWDPTALQFQGKIDNGPYSWSPSWFPDDSDLEGLNADCGSDVFCDPYSSTPYNDGDAYYAAFGQFAPNPPPYATPEGLLVTTLVFTAGTVTPATELRVLESVGVASTTVMYADEHGTQIVTGELGSLTISIATCALKGDLDRDCTVDLADLEQFGTCLTGPDGGPLEPQCQPADFDGDCDADMRDVASFQSAFGQLGAP